MPLTDFPEEGVISWIGQSFRGDENGGRFRRCARQGVEFLLEQPGVSGVELFLEREDMISSDLSGPFQVVGWNSKSGFSQPIGIVADEVLNGRTTGLVCTDMEYKPTVHFRFFLRGQGL
ncbi:MAG: hypothetical protein L0Y50_01240 [Beijerinckiaceae bacterium]|nr:hypothetical protein [Beijerinckiaceae bacterium]MCI0734897.1 hypothetical protein [Beijerinckiaceae bacterium]